MNDKSNNNWYSSSDRFLSKTIGNFIRHNRTEQQLTQEELADKANISRSTLSLLERGETVTVATLLQVLRVLNLLHVKAEQEERQRVRKAKSQNKKDSEW